MLSALNAIALTMTGTQDPQGCRSSQLIDKSDRFNEFDVRLHSLYFVL